MDTPPYCIQLMYSRHFTTLYRRIVMYSGHTTILYTSNVYWTLSRLFAFGTQSHYVHWEQSLTPVYRMPGQIMLIFQKRKEIFIIFFFKQLELSKTIFKNNQLLFFYIIGYLYFNLYFHYNNLKEHIFHLVSSFSDSRVHFVQQAAHWLKQMTAF